MATTITPELDRLLGKLEPLLVELLAEFRRLNAARKGGQS